MIILGKNQADLLTNVIGALNTNSTDNLEQIFSQLSEEEFSDVLTSSVGPVKQTVIHLAVVIGTPDVLKLLLSFNAPLDVVDELGFTPAAYAIVRKSRTMLEILLEHGSRPDFEIRNGVRHYMHYVVPT